MKEKLAERNNDQFQIGSVNRQIKKVQALILKAKKCQKEALDQTLKSLRKRLSILKKKTK